MLFFDLHLSLSTCQGDILDDMLGAAPTVAPVATVAPVTPTPAAIISPKKPQCAVDPFPWLYFQGLFHPSDVPFESVQIQNDIVSNCLLLMFGDHASSWLQDLTAVLYDLCLMAQFITYSTADCAQPGQVSSICASDVASLVRRTAETSGYLSDAVFSCGNVDGSCPQTISNAISKTADATNYIIGMEITCFDSLFCTYQVFAFMSSAIVAAKNIDTAVFQCAPSDDGDGDDGDDGDAGDGDDGAACSK